MYEYLYGYMYEYLYAHKTCMYGCGVRDHAMEHQNGVSAMVFFLSKNIIFRFLRKRILISKTLTIIELTYQHFRSKKRKKSKYVSRPKVGCILQINPAYLNFLRHRLVWLSSKIHPIL